MLNLPPTSFFHGLYRLRLRSNYADAESFLFSLENTFESKQFHRSLRTLAWHTLRVIELVIARYVGKRVFGSWVDEFVKIDRGGLGADLVQHRWQNLQRLW